LNLLFLALKTRFNALKIPFHVLNIVFNVWKILFHALKTFFPVKKPASKTSKPAATVWLTGSYAKKWPEPMVWPVTAPLFINGRRSRKGNKLFGIIFGRRFLATDAHR